MSKSIIDDILAEAEQESLVKIANDPQGAPETANDSNSGQTDIVSTANAFLQELEQFKATLGGNVAAQGQEDPNQQGVPEGDPNAPQVPQEQQQGGGATIQTPGGTIIKLAAMAKLASIKGRSLFSEVE